MMQKYLLNYSMERRLHENLPAHGAQQLALAAAAP